MAQGRYTWTKRSAADALGVSLPILASDLKKIYLERARAVHPDTGSGDENAFIRVREAYEYLLAHAKHPTSCTKRPRPCGGHSYGPDDVNFLMWKLMEELQEARARASVAKRAPARKPHFWEMSLHGFKLFVAILFPWVVALLIGLAFSILYGCYV